MIQPTPEQLAYARALGEAILRFTLSIRQEYPEPKPFVCNYKHVESPPVQPVQSVEQSERLLTCRETHEFLSIGLRKLWEITSPRGPLPAVRFGRVVRYSLAELRKWIGQEIVASAKKSYKKTT